MTTCTIAPPPDVARNSLAEIVDGPFKQEQGSGALALYKCCARTDALHLAPQLRDGSLCSGLDSVLPLVQAGEHVLPR